MQIIKSDNTEGCSIQYPFSSKQVIIINKNNPKTIGLIEAEKFLDIDKEPMKLLVKHEDYILAILIVGQFGLLIKNELHPSLQKLFAVPIPMFEIGLRFHKEMKDVVCDNTKLLVLNLIKYAELLPKVDKKEDGAESITRHKENS